MTDKPDANELLADIRDFLAQDRRQLDDGGLHRDDAATLMSRMEDLDQALSEGALLPTAWLRAPEIDWSNHKSAAAFVSTLDNGQRAALVSAALGPFVVRWPKDDLARDPALLCERCGTSVCDVEHGDTLDVLARTALDHQCTQPT